MLFFAHLFTGLSLIVAGAFFGLFFARATALHFLGLDKDDAFTGAATFFGTIISLFTSMVCFSHNIIDAEYSLGLVTALTFYQTCFATAAVPAVLLTCKFIGWFCRKSCDLVDRFLAFSTRRTR